MLDDPTSSLDSKVTAKIINKILSDEEFSQKTFMITTNNPNLLEQADKVVFLKKGRMEFVGSPKDFFSQYEVTREKPEKVGNLDGLPEKQEVKLLRVG